MTFDQLVDRVVAMFDTAPTEVTFWANQRHKRMVGEALYRLAELSLGNTVAGQSDYDLPEADIDIALLQVGADTEPYVRGGVPEMVGLRAGTHSVNNAPGAFSIYADAAGDLKIRLNPTPTASGTAIIGWGVIESADLTYGSGAALLPPAHLHSYLLDGVIADAHAQIENRWDLAAPFEQRYELGIDKLRRFKNSRVGGGPTRIARAW